jgi:hypothetical protein
MAEHSDYSIHATLASDSNNGLGQQQASQLTNEDAHITREHRTELGQANSQELSSCQQAILDFLGSKAPTDEDKLTFASDLIRDYDVKVNDELKYLTQRLLAQDAPSQNAASENVNNFKVDQRADDLAVLCSLLPLFGKFGHSLYVDLLSSSEHCLNRATSLVDQKVRLNNLYLLSKPVYEELLEISGIKLHKTQVAAAPDTQSPLPKWYIHILQGSFIDKATPSNKALELLETTLNKGTFADCAELLSKICHRCQDITALDSVVESFEKTIGRFVEHGSFKSESEEQKANECLKLVAQIQITSAKSVSSSLESTDFSRLSTFLPLLKSPNEITRVLALEALFDQAFEGYAFSRKNAFAETDSVSSINIAKINKSSTTPRPVSDMLKSETWSEIRYVLSDISVSDTSERIRQSVASILTFSDSVESRVKGKIFPYFGAIYKAITLSSTHSS